jgi:hypothetical protein
MASFAECFDVERRKRRVLSFFLPVEPSEIAEAQAHVAPAQQDMENLNADENHCV